MCLKNNAQEDKPDNQDEPTPLYAHNIIYFSLDVLVSFTHLEDKTTDCSSCFPSSRQAASHFVSFAFQNCISENSNLKN